LIFIFGFFISAVVLRVSQSLGFEVPPSSRSRGASADTCSGVLVWFFVGLVLGVDLS
jgi:hypothetical protein